MDSPIFPQWQQWETRVQEWLNQPDDNLEFSDTTSSDRLILTILTVKYQVLYQDMDKESEATAAKKHDERKSTVKLSRTKLLGAKEEKERRRDKEKIFDNLTGRFLSPQQVTNETSPEWQEFDQLCQWHGLAFIRRFENCLRRFVSELISTTPAYKKFIHEPARIPSATLIENQLYEAKNDAQVFLSVDMKSANFTILQYINAIDIHMYATWSDFLTVFVGRRPLLLASKKLRMRCLGNLPEFYKLEALWTDYTTTIYRDILFRCLDENDVDARCVALQGDEVVFHLNASIRIEKVIDLVEHVQQRLTKESPIVKFLVQAYRLQVFHWKKKHVCFARLFIGENNGQFDLKCLPDKDRNYEQACADFRIFSGL